MPTERFYRLPREKADIIRKAAIEEFKRVPPEEASINKIIQSADISRGSFYTYFEDKYDLLKWLMGDFIDSYKQFYVITLEENHGDIWDVFDRVFDFACEWAAKQGLVEIVGNMMKSKAFEEQFQGCPAGNAEMEENRQQNAGVLYGLVGSEYCSVSVEDFMNLMELHVGALIVALKLYFTKAQSLEKIRESYDRKMRLLRYGAYPKQE